MGWKWVFIDGANQMELIKKIKEAENQAKTLVQEANEYSAETEKIAARERQGKLEAALQRRKEIVVKAQQDGKAQGQAEAEQMGQQGKTSEDALRGRANEKSGQAVAKIADFIKSQA
ncbi:MAG: hypothetical protein K8R02_06075 [Anaerohalosphaeraceae bacterium]|nr:hypothetical protein [Anaerohalosphaeraceae bacterium]